jgi:hypothetical protein
MTEAEKWALEQIRAANGSGYRCPEGIGRKRAKPFEAIPAQGRRRAKPKRGPNAEKRRRWLFQE